MAKLNYEYDGKAAVRLLQSYREDKKPFITDTSLQFPERSNDWEEVKKLKEIFFPNCWNCGLITKPENMNELRKKLNELGRLFFCGISAYLSDEKSEKIVDNVLDELPKIREMLKKDVEAAYSGDPAARSYAEIIRAYPGFIAVMIQRVTHVMYKLRVPSYPREIMEHIHTITGIDIHPGAKIGAYFL